MTTIEKLDLAFKNVEGDKGIIFTLELQKKRCLITARKIEDSEREYERLIGEMLLENYLNDRENIKYSLEMLDIDDGNLAYMYVTTNNKIICEYHCNYNQSIFNVFGYDKEKDDSKKFLKDVIFAVRKCICETEIQIQNQTTNPNNNGVNKKEYIRDDHIYPLCIAHIRYGSKKTEYQEKKEKELLVDKYESFQRILERTPNLTIRFTDDPKRAISVEELFHKFGGKEAEKKDK